MLSLISLIAGIIGVAGSLAVVWIPIAGGILQLFIPAAAVVLGFLGRKKEPASKGMWLTGIILGFVGIVAGLTSVIFWIVVFASIGSYDGYSRVLGIARRREADDLIGHPPHEPVGSSERPGGEAMSESEAALLPEPPSAAAQPVELAGRGGLLVCLFLPWGAVASALAVIAGIIARPVDSYSRVNRIVGITTRAWSASLIAAVWVLVAASGIATRRPDRVRPVAAAQTRSTSSVTCLPGLAGEHDGGGCRSLQLQALAQLGRIDVDAALLDLERADAALAKGRLELLLVGGKRLEHAERRRERGLTRDIRR